MFSPALSAPLHARYQRQQDCRQTSGSVVVDEMSAVQSDDTPSEHNEPSEEANMRMILIRQPLRQQTPSNTK